MHHELYEVTGYTIVGPYTLRITFDDNTSKTIDFWPMLAVNLYGPCETARCSSAYDWMRRSAHWSGRTAPISTRPPCTTGTLSAKR